MARTMEKWVRGRVGLMVLTALMLTAVSNVVSPAPTVHAANFTVNTTADAIDAHPGDGICATSSGACSLRAAIMEANALGGGSHTITLQAGTVYGLTLTSDLDIRANLTIQGSAITPATIKPTPPAGVTWNGRILYIAPGVTLTLNGLVLSGGNVGSLGENGGAIYIDGAVGSPATLTLQNTRVQNSAGMDGGAIYNYGGTLTLINSTVANNNAGQRGGGIFNDFGSVNLSKGSVLQTNTATDDGGGLYNDDGPVTVQNSTLSGNISNQGYGGAIYNNLGDLTLTGSTLSGGSAIFGGVLYNDGFLTAATSTFAGAHANSGGGIYVTDADTVNITGSTVSGNTAYGQGGGGIYTRGSLVLLNSTISGNVAQSSDGGGIENTSPNLQLNNVTVAGNTASGHGGGIASSGGGAVANSILATNTAASAPDCAGTLSSQGYNLVGNASGCTISGTTTGNIFNQEPRLGPLQSNGGSTQTQALLQQNTSCPLKGPCAIYNPSLGIDVGNPAPVAPFTTISTACLPTDQRGVARPTDGNGDGTARCDIGAYEAQALPNLGSFTLTPKPTPPQVGQHLIDTFAWTVPSGGWRSLDSLYLVLRDDQGTALWLRFHEVAGNGSTLGLIDPKDLSLGPAFPFGSPNRLETNAATVYLATSSLDGPAGSPTVTLTLDLGFKPQAAGRTFTAQVLASNDVGDFEGFVDAGTLTVSPR